jgi:hypothetical protein
LNSSATGGVASTVGLYYGQAGSIVGFLVDTYGAEKFAELLRTFKEGATQDAAFTEVYALDALGIENAWRESVGLDARAASPTVTPEPQDDATATPRAGTTAPDDAGGIGADDGAPVGTIALFVLLGIAAVGATGAAIHVARQRL